jgi:hypothetical protein
MNLLPSLPWTRTECPALLPEISVLLEPAPEEPPAESAGCGWFESSQDLTQGLQVSELAPTDAALPLAWWLQWQTGPAPAVRFC